jgi:hypothetical protein
MLGMVVVRAVGAFALAVLAATEARAEESKCHVVEVDFMPAEIATPVAMRAPSQIVAWIEDASGNYVDTIFITQQTGTYGLGNRPGRWDFNSGPNWPYGRRVTVFPVWAHRRAASGAPTWQEVVYQNADDSNLSHPFNQSSREMRFCRPLRREEPGWDAGTCASTVFTDKGIFDVARTSLYPPRNDLTRTTPDHESVDQYAMLNPFDAVSMATPASGIPAELTWPIPDALPPGEYVLWVEVSREFDHNATYSITAAPSPASIPWAEYGEPYRGQPSVLYKVGFTMGAQVTSATTLDYVGYGDPTGLDGNVRAPDATISTGVPGSGAERFAVRVDAQNQPYRLRVTSRPELDFVEPARPNNPQVNTLSQTSAVVEFTAPGDDGLAGKVRGYEIRYVQGDTLTDDTFTRGIELRPDIAIVEPGALQEFPIEGLLFDTEYTVGIRAYDDCRNTGKIAYVTFKTPPRQTGEVDACFVATAAYGSVLANDVEMLRRFRDFMLQQTVLGELAVEAYYTFGPAVAGVVGESELLRASARAVLAPIVDVVKVMKW